MAQTPDSGRGAVPNLYKRSYPSGRFAWFVRYTHKGIRKTVRVCGDAPRGEVRRLARQILHEVDKGGDPARERQEAREEPTVAAVLERALLEHWAEHAKERTEREIRRLVEKKISPKLGRLKISELDYQTVSRWHRGMGDTPGQANRALAALSKSCSLAIQWGLIEQNPCRRVSRYRENKCERYLSDDEYAQLLGALVESGEDPYAIGCIALLAFTGWRRGEAVSLRWDDVDLERRRVLLRDTKTRDDRWCPINPEAVRVLVEIPRTNAWVFPLRRFNTLESLDGHIHPDTISKVWERVRVAADLADVRLHDLRHSYASMAVRRGLSLPIIGRLLGHKSPATTARYAHLADTEASEASDLVGSAIVATKK